MSRFALLRRELLGCFFKGLGCSVVGVDGEANEGFSKNSHLLPGWPGRMDMQRRDKSQLYAALKYSKRSASGAWRCCAPCRSFSLTARCAVLGVSVTITLHNRKASAGRRARG